MFSDSEVNVALTEDGRLKSINATSTGAGEAIIGSFAKLIPLVLAGSAKDNSADLKAICDVVSKPPDEIPAKLTLVGTLYQTAGNFGKPIELQPDAASRKFFNILGSRAQSVVVEVDEPKILTPRIQATGAMADGTTLTLAKMAIVEVEVKSSQRPVGKSKILVPSGQTYLLPIPRAKAFGASKFNLEIADSGAITSIGYAKTSGTSAAIGSAGVLHSTLRPSDAE